jgi:hypothetical protein
MKNLKQHILEKLKVSKEYKLEIEFSWYEFIKLIYKNDYVVSLLAIYENGNPIFKEFSDLPEFTPNTSKPKYMYATSGGFIIGLRVEATDLDNDWLEVMYKLDKNGNTYFCKAESFGDLKDFLDTELIIQIYDYLKQNA